MEFRPCIDIHNGKVKQIVGGSLLDEGNRAKENFVAEQDAAFFAKLYREQGLKGGHIILLNPVGSEYYEATKAQAELALQAYPGGFQIGGGIHHAQIGHRELFGLSGGVGAGHRAAGRHDALDILGEQERDVLPGILQDGLRAAAAVGHSAGVAKVDDVFVGQPPAQLPHTGQAAQAAVKYADGAVIHAAFPSFPAQVRSGNRSGRARGCPRVP